MNSAILAGRRDADPARRWLEFFEKSEAANNKGHKRYMRINQGGLRGLTTSRAKHTVFIAGAFLLLPLISLAQERRPPLGAYHSMQESKMPPFPFLPFPDLP